MWKNVRYLVSNFLSRLQVEVIIFLDMFCFKCVTYICFRWSCYFLIWLLERFELHMWLAFLACIMCPLGCSGLDFGAVLSNPVDKSHIWLFKFVLIKNK